MLPSLSAVSYAGGVAGPASTSSAIFPEDIYIPEFGNGVDLALIFTIDLSGTEPATAAATGVFSCTIPMRSCITKRSAC